MFSTTPCAAAAVVAPPPGMPNARSLANAQ